mgnify:CR=1 FL=1
MIRTTYFFLLLLFCLDSTAQSEKNAARIKCAQGDTAYEAKEYDHALMIYEECLQLNPAFPEAQFRAARTAYFTGNLPKARKYIDLVLATRNKAFKKKPEYQEVFRIAALIENKENPPFVEMVAVLGGSFTMGCQPGRDSDCEDQEKPSHRVVLSDFYIGKYEVTQAQWKVVMGYNPSGFTGCDSCPVESVSWDMVQLFIDKLNQIYPGFNYRLATDAEWEFAARGGNKSKGFKYCGSNNPDEVAWYSANSGNVTHLVGTKAPNELGIYDMGGNVWEWCSDIFSLYTVLDATNPQGPPNGTHRVDRGGCWQYTVKYTRPGMRGDLNPVDLGNDLGFRLAHSGPLQQKP